jgi:hypothetical protein
MRNHQSRPTSSGLFLEANVTAFSEANATSFKENHGRGRGRNNVWRREGHNSKSNDNNAGRYENEKNYHLLKCLKIIVIDVV